MKGGGGGAGEERRRRREEEKEEERRKWLKEGKVRIRIRNAEKGRRLESGSSVSKANMNRDIR